MDKNCEKRRDASPGSHVELRASSPADAVIHTPPRISQAVIWASCVALTFKYHRILFDHRTLVSWTSLVKTMASKSQIRIGYVPGMSSVHTVVVLGIAET